MNEDENSGSIQITNSDEHADDNEIKIPHNTNDTNNSNNIDTHDTDNNTNNTDDDSDESYTQNSILFYFKRLFTVELKTAKTPYFMLSAFVKAADYKVALGFIVIQSLLFASVVAAILDSVNDLINNLTSLLGSSLYKSETFSIAAVFIVAFITSIMLLFAFSLILDILVAVLMKSKATYKQMLCITSSKCIAQIPFTIIAFIASIFSPIAAIFIASLGTLLGYFFVVSALKGLDNASENKITYVAFLSFAIISLVSLAVVALILPLFLSPAILSLKRGLY